LGNVFAQNKNIDSLLTLIKSDKSDTNTVNHLNRLCWEYLSVGLYDTALHYSNAALQISQQLNSKKGIANSYYNIGAIYYYQGNSSKALEYYFKVLKIQEGLGDKIRIAKLLGNIGVVYAEQNNYPLALEYYFKALKIAEELRNKNLIGYEFRNIGNTYLDQADYGQALDYYLKASKVAEDLKDKKMQAFTFGCIGNMYRTQGNGSQALDYYFKSLKIAEGFGDKNAIAANISNIGIVYADQANYPQALDYNFKALKMAEELGDKSGIVTCLGSIGPLYIKIGKYKEAEQYLKKAIALADSIGALDYLRQFEISLSQLYDDTKKYNLALIHYKKSVALKDTIFSQENKKQLVRKAMNYEFDKKTEAIKAENEKQQAIAEEKNRQQKIVIWSVLVGLLLVVVFSGFIFRSLRITRKQKNTIEVQKNEVSKQKEAADNQRIIAEGLREVSEKQKELVEEKQKEIIQSITYAKRIQTALLTSDGYIKEHLPAEHFVLFKPKDIVSGDFYWAISIAPFPGWDMGSNKIKLPSTTKKQNTFYMMTADCTGHGVPGAFMSMLNISYLHENIVERGIRLPHDILNSQRKEIIEALNPAGSIEESKDGMDCTLCVYDFDKMLLHFASANNPLWLVRNQELTEYKADKMPVGKYSEEMRSFTLQTIALQKGDVIYTSTDGFADQFGVTGKKLMKKKMKEELLKIHQQPMDEQKEYLDHFFESWKGNHEQVDDVTVIGVRI